MKYIRKFASYILVIAMLMCFPLAAFAEELVDGAQVVATNEMVEDNNLDKDLSSPIAEFEVSGHMGEDKAELNGSAASTPFEYLYYTMFKVNGNERPITRVGTGDGVGVAYQKYKAEINELDFGDNERFPIIEFSILQRGNTQSGVIPYTEDAVIQSGTSHNLDIRNGVVIEWRNDYKITSIKDNADKIVISAKFKPIQSNITQIYERVLEITINDGRPDAPTTPEFVMSKSAQGKFELTGVDSTMEYTEKGKDQWISCTDNQMLFDATENAVRYLVRYKATEGAKASKAKEILLVAQAAAPNIKYGNVYDTFTGLTKDMEYKLDDGEYMPVTDEIIEKGAAPYLDELAQDKTLTMTFRVAATDTKPASKETSFTLYPRREAPTGLTYKPGRYILSGTTSDMLYQVKGQGWYYVRNNTTLNFSSYAKVGEDSYVDVFYMAGDKKSASKRVRFPILRYSPQVTDYSIDYKNNAIKLNPQRNYRYNVRNAWDNLKDGADTLDIESYLSVSSSKTIYIRTKETDEIPVGESTPIVLPKLRPAPTGLSFVYDTDSATGKAELLNATENMEYRTSDSNTWVSCDKAKTLIAPTGSVRYVYVRYKGTDNEFSSASAGIYIKARPKAPEYASYQNQQQEYFYGFGNNAEVSVNDGPYKDMAAGSNYVISDEVDRIPKGQANVYKIRTKATKNTPASLDRTFKILARHDQPKNLKYNANTGKIEGVYAGCQYRVKGETTWNILFNNELKVGGPVQGRQIEIRKMGDTQGSASLPVVINQY